MDPQTESGQGLLATTRPFGVQELFLMFGRSGIMHRLNDAVPLIKQRSGFLVNYVLVHVVFILRRFRRHAILLGVVYTLRAVVADKDRFSCRVLIESGEDPSNPS